MNSVIRRSRFLTAKSACALLLAHACGCLGALPVTNGLALHLAADQGATTNASGRVTAWADLSGSGHSASQASGSYQPAWVAGQLNGLPVVRFGTGGSHFLNLAGQLLTSQTFSMIVVTRDVSASTSYRELISNWSPAYAGSSVFFGTTAQSPVRARFTDDFGGAGTGQTGVGTITNPTSFFIFSAVSGSNSVAVYQGTNAIATRASALSPRTLTGSYAVGQQGNLMGEFWQGDIAEMVVYNRELGPSELAQVWAYLMAKYLPAQLPPTIQSIWPVQNKVAISFQMNRPTNYFLEAKGDLRPGSWLTVTQMLGGGVSSNVTVLDGRTNAQRFYRLRVGQ